MSLFLYMLRSRQRVLVVTSIIISLVVSTRVQAQSGYFSEFPIWHSEQANRTVSIAIGDIDADGDLDLVCGNQNNRITLYENTGDKLASLPSWYSGESITNPSVALGDVDGDGDLDLICGKGSNGPTLYGAALYENTGNTFSSLPIWASSPTNNTRCVALGDVDGDGDLDLICGNEGESTTLYENTGGTFSSLPIWASGQANNTICIVLGDVDGDGDLDLVCGNYDQSSTLYENMGGTFASMPKWSQGLASYTHGVALGDVDGDGDLDLVSGDYGDGASLYENTGGTFSSMPMWNSGRYHLTSDIALGDVDGDGDLDLICGNMNSPAMLYENTGGTFAAIPVWFSGQSLYTVSVALGDMDGDGDLDLVCGNYDQSSKLYENTSNAFGSIPTWSSGQVSDTRSVVLGDVDGDSDLDLVCGNWDERVTLYLNTGSTYTPQPMWASNQSYRTNSVNLGDVDGDGDLDLVCGNWFQPAVLFKNTGGIFTSMPVWSSGQDLWTTSTALGDVDGDGDIDLVCGIDSNDDHTSLYENTGGTFSSTPMWSSSRKSSTRCVDLGDVDGDGDLDLVCGDFGQCSLYENTAGIFSSLPGWISDQGNWTHSIDLGDVDGDGDLDLVCGNSYASNTLYENAGGTFTSLPIWFSGSSDWTKGVSFGDMDGDGDLDLMCGNLGASWALYENSGGALADMPTSSIQESSISTTSIALGDVDNDGDLDLVCGNQYGATLYSGRMSPAFKGDPLSPANHLPNNGAHVRLVETEKIDPACYRISLSSVDVESDPIWLIHEYQYEGEPVWHPAIINEQHGKIGPFVTSPGGVRDSMEWDTHLMPFDSRNVILRIRAIEIPKSVSIVQHSALYLKNIGPIIPYRPAISSEDVISFSAVTLGDATSASLHISNQGTANLTITNIDFPTPDMRIEEIFPIQVAPRSGVEISVLLAPTSDADIEGPLVIYSNDPFLPAKTVRLSAHVRPLDFTFADLSPTGEIPEATPFNVSITMRDYVYVDSAYVFIRQGGQALFDSIRLQRIDDPVNEQYFGSIPASSIGTRGIEFFVRVYNDRFTRDSLSRPLRTRVKNMDFAMRPPAAKYGMITLPLETESPILGVLSDDLGGQDNTKWRLWNYDSPSASYVEIPNDEITHFEVSRGYWLIMKEPHQLDTGPAEGLSTPMDSPYEIALGPGWSLLGNPFAFPVAWNSIEVDTFTMQEAELAGVIEPLWRWDPAASRYQQDVTELEPFSAYWVINKTDPPREITLHVPPEETIGEEEPASTPAAREERAHSDSWEITIRVICGDTGSNHNRIGVYSQGLETHDPLDRSEPPMSPDEGMSLYFPHFSWSQHKGRYAVDMRAPTLEEGMRAATQQTTSREGTWGHVWLFDVAKSFSGDMAGDEVALEFCGMDSIPEDMAILLVDKVLKRVADLRKESTYRFYQGKRDYVKEDEDSRFLLLAGNDEFVESYGEELPGIPAETVLYQNYPNPFNPSTVIRYDLAKAGRVRLKVYDVSGALVKVLEDRNRDPGRYEIGWNGENERDESVSSGVYFYVLETPGTRIAKKMLCVK